jgi:sugar O-acyltransferase (sialic acid O-acetyltransferase NeuD family)
MDIVIIGDKHWCKAVADIHRRGGQHTIVGVLLDEEEPPNELLGYPVVGHTSDLVHVIQRTGLRRGTLAMADIATRMDMAQRIALVIPDFRFEMAVDPSATVGAGTHLGQGVIIFPGARVEAGSRIGEHTSIGSNACIGADGHLGSFVSVGAGVAMEEGCHVGTGTSIGVNSALVRRIIIGTHCAVGPGAMVIENVPDLHVAIGTPAKCVRTRRIGEPYL